MPRANKSRYVILGLLSHEPLSGYNIKKRIETGVSYFYGISYGQIYPELARLEKQGFVVEEAQPDKNSRNRKIYAITEKGKKELQKWLAAQAEEEKVHYDILLKLFFGSNISIAENIRNITEFRERNIRKLRLLEQYEANLRSVLDLSLDHKYYLLTVLLGRQVYKAHIAWAEEAIALLGEE